LQYKDIIERIELSASCIVGDITADWDNPEELNAEGIKPWDEQSLSEMIEEVVSAFAQQFLEVLPLKPEDHDPDCKIKGSYLGGECQCDSDGESIA